MCFLQRLIGLLNVRRLTSLSAAASAVSGVLHGDASEPPPPPRALLPPPEVSPGAAGTVPDKILDKPLQAVSAVKRKAAHASVEEPLALRRVRALAQEECTHVRHVTFRSPVYPDVHPL